MSKMLIKKMRRSLKSRGMLFVGHLGNFKKVTVRAGSPAPSAQGGCYTASLWSGTIVTVQQWHSARRMKIIQVD